MSKKVIPLFLVMVLLVGLLPQNLVLEGKAEGLLTIEAASKYKGFIASEEHRISVLQEDGTVLETAFTDEKSEISEWKDIRFLSSMDGSTVGLKKDGTVVVTEDYQPELTQQVADWKGIKEISSNWASLLGLKEDGTVLFAGRYGYDVSGWKDIASISAADEMYAGLKRDGTVVVTGRNAPPAEVEQWKNIVAVTAGNTHIAGLKSDGTVVASGLLKDQVSSWTNIVAISSGDEHLVGLRSDGTLVGAGRSHEGQLNFSDWKNIVAVQATNYFTAALKSDGTLLVVGDSFGGQKQVGSWTDITAISAGEKHILGLKKDGTVVAQGGTGYGQAFVGNWNDIVQISAGRATSFGVKKDGTVVSAGNTGNGERKVEGWTDIIQVSAGDSHTVGLKRDGTVVATGYNYSGQTKVEDWRDIVQVSAGEFHTIGVKSDGTVIAAGQNEYGQGDVGSWTNIKQVAAGSTYTVGLKHDGTVVGTGLRSDIMNFDGWKDIKSIALGWRHAVGLKQDGTVVATGLNSFGQLNVEEWKDIVAISAGKDYTVGLKSDGTVVSTSWDVNAASSAVSVDKRVAKPGDTVHIISKNNRFFTKQSNAFTLSGSVAFTGEFDEQGVASYLVDKGDVGRVSISMPGTTDFFGNPFAKSELFQVVPLKSLTVSKSEAKPGEKVTFTAEFYQPVKPGFRLALTGAVKQTGVSMTEVSGSNGLKYMYQYTVPADYSKGSVHAEVKDIVLTDGTRFDPYLEANIFTKIGRTAPVTSLTVSHEKAKLWDLVIIRASFSEKMKAGVKLSLEGGAELQEVVMSEVEGSAGKEFVYGYSVPWGASGQVRASLTDMVDYAGNFYDEYKKDNLFITDGLPPIVEKVESSTDKAKLGDKVLVTMTLTEPVNPGVKMILLGGTPHQNVDMSVVPGSNGLQYSYEYTVTSQDQGMIQGLFHDFQDDFGNSSTNSTHDLFFADGKKPELVSVTTDEKVYGRGDFVHVVGEFSEPLKPGVKIKLSGAVNKEFAMSEVAGSEGRRFEVYLELNESSFGQVHAQFTSIEDMAGNTVSISRPGLFYISNGANANLAGISVGGYQLNIPFSPDVTEYEAIVPISAGTVMVNAEPEDPSAVVTGITPVNLVFGNNVHVIKVTSKNGTVKEYKLTIKAVDTDKPIFKGITDPSIKAGSKFDSLAGITAVDTIDGDLTGSIKVTGIVNTGKPGNYLLEYSVSDNAGNTAKATRTVTVIDDQQPVFSGVADKTVFVNASFNPLDGVKATDNVDGDLTSSIVMDGLVNLKVAGTYSVTYTVTDSSGNKAAAVRKITVKPAAPIQVKAASASYNSIKISWGAVSGATGYEVYMATSPSGTYSYAGSTSTTSFTKGSLATNATYYFKIRAYQTVGGSKVYSDYSAAGSAKPVPSVPGFVKAASASYNSIKISWGAVSGATGYDVYRAASSTGKYTYVGTTKYASFTNTGLATNSPYYYKVRAYRLVGTVKVYSGYSSTVTAKPVPSVPASVKAASASYNSIKVSWGAVSGATGYAVYRATSSTGTYSYVGTTKATSFTNSALTTNKLYYYKIRAYRTVGKINVYSGYSAAVSTKPLPSVPAGFTAARYTSSSIKLTWGKVAGATGYEISRSTTKSGTYKTIKTTSSASFINTGLAKGKTYYYKVRAYRLVGKTKIYSGWTVIKSARL
ncbi:immunoglobulin-like domain-containing protein [Bacillus sp. EB01]|uniref:immunoglobulin-like domain-containing protein n=1 Tax=Bacillus sp. EB01 TaxID=1347086 RepID=UPI000694B23B|nr:immunoglobulin-like domain-containing protein [Bacillus sp. EB01]